VGARLLIAAKKCHNKTKDVLTSIKYSLCLSTSILGALVTGQMTDATEKPEQKASVERLNSGAENTSADQL
jgi:hypothetical protein